MTPSQEEAALRIRQALQRIERAQNELDAACSELSSIVGLVREWEALGKLSERVKAFWHRLAGRRGPSKPWDLDEMAKQSLWRRQVEQRSKGGQPQQS